MFYSFLADAVLLFHLAFILFVVFGALPVWYFPRLAWLHLPAVIWAGLIEVGGFVCPLTPLENQLRHLGGKAGYEGGFIEHYLLPIIYPDQLPRGVQAGLGVAVFIINVLAYALLHRRARAVRRQS